MGQANSKVTDEIIDGLQSKINTECKKDLKSVNLNDVYKIPCVCVSNKLKLEENKDIGTICSTFTNSEFKYEGSDDCISNIFYNEDGSLNRFTNTYEAPKDAYNYDHGKTCNMKKIQYSGDQHSCCLDGETNDNFTCDPDFRNSLGCENLFRTSCDLEIFSDKSCLKYKDFNPTVYYDKVAQLCNDANFFEIHKKSCIDFCSKNDGLCDSTIPNYCRKEENVTADICSCLNTAHENLPLNPICFGGTCSALGYKTSTLVKNPQCPSDYCSLVFNLTSNSTDVKNNKMKCDSSKNSKDFDLEDTMITYAFESNGVNIDKKISTNEIILIAAGSIALLALFMVWLFYR